MCAAFPASQSKIIRSYSVLTIREFRQACYRTPSLRRNIIIGHQFVNAD